MTDTTCLACERGDRDRHCWDCGAGLAAPDDICTLCPDCLDATAERSAAALETA